MNVLVLDDMEETVDMLCDNLQDAGHSATGVTSFPEAMRVSNEIDYDCVIADLNLNNHMTGLDFLSQHKQKHPGSYAIVTTGYPEQLETKNHHWCNAIFRKPFDPDEIIKKIGEWEKKKNDETRGIDRRVTKLEERMDEFEEQFKKLSDRVLEYIGNSWKLVVLIISTIAVPVIAIMSVFFLITKAVIEESYEHQQRQISEIRADLRSLRPQQAPRPPAKTDR